VCGHPCIVTATVHGRNGHSDVIAAAPSEADGEVMTTTQQRRAPGDTIGATSSSEPEPSAAAPERRRSIGTVVIVSLGGAVVLAVLLDLLVFGGATERTITSATLLAFAAGWTALWRLSGRTGHPQRWAAAPAAFFAIGAALAITVGTSLGWLWPPALLGLVAWMAPHARRELPGRTRRWVLYPVFVVMTVTAVASAGETALEHVQASPTMPGRLIDVGGRRLHLDCTGTGSPTVVLQAGLGGTGTEVGAWIAPAVATSTRVCAYDRAGRGFSDGAGHPQTSDEVVADLHELLVRAGEHGPFVIAGHSEGGAYAMNFAYRYPGDVAGLVLLDSMHPDQRSRIPGWAFTYEVMRRGTALFPPLARLGLARAIAATSYGSLPPAARSELRGTGSNPRQASSLRDETSLVLGTLRAAKRLQTIGDRPLAVVTASKGALPRWASAQDDLAKLSSNSSHRTVTTAAHDDLIVDESAAAQSSAAILDVVAAVRSNARIAS
jgi:pimeloyl-ACP methyl ester carboxylesterase